MLSGIAELRGWRQARPLSIFAGAGLVTFEAAELAWIGPQPLEALFAGVGLAVALLGATPREDGATQRLPPVCRPAPVGALNARLNGIHVSPNTIV